MCEREIEKERKREREGECLSLVLVAMSAVNFSCWPIDGQIDCKTDF